MKELRSVLILDDDKIILIALRETIAPEGFEIVTADRPHDAIKLLEEQEFSIIISDQRMPDMTGLEFFEHAKRIQPNASRVLITGVLTLNTIIQAVNEGEIYRFVAKPWIREEIIATVHNAQQRYTLITANQRLQEDALQLNETLTETNAKLEEQVEALAKSRAELDQAHLALSKNFDHSLQLYLRLLETYNPLLGEETRAVVDLCQHMIDLGKFNETDAHTLKVSAWLKNIGLLTIPRDLHNRYRKKRSELTEEEIAKVEHTPIFAQSLASFVDSLKGVGVTIRAQYERWDGKGFPDGLAGNLIPRPARFLAVAVYYVECGLSREEALATILDESGNRFAPEAVQLFVDASRPARLPRTLKEVSPGELRVGMTLAKDVYSAAGLLLIPAGQKLDRHMIEKVRGIDEAYPLQHRLLVYNQ
ncbi:MAG: response regulator receiver [Puniceicoccaceae bacterium 5H]|nr:MAG: response regulator receiver [Puniceicoccaceae bacterium 5H]